MLSAVGCFQSQKAYVLFSYTTADTLLSQLSSSGEITMNTKLPPQAKQTLIVLMLMQAKSQYYHNLCLQPFFAYHHTLRVSESCFF